MQRCNAAGCCPRARAARPGIVYLARERGLDFDSLSVSALSHCQFATTTTIRGRGRDVLLPLSLAGDGRPRSRDLLLSCCCWQWHWHWLRFRLLSQQVRTRRAGMEMEPSAAAH